VTIVLDILSKPNDFEFKKSRVRRTGSANLQIFGTLPNPQ